MSTFPAGKVVSISDKSFNFSVASTVMDLMRGLSGAKSLDPFDGMLFDFGHETNIIMTPRGMLFSLEIAFIKDDGTIVEIATLSHSLNMNLPSRERVRYALEVPVGFFNDNKIAVGDRFNFGEVS
jgi:uncharacterized protein